MKELLARAERIAREAGTELAAAELLTVRAELAQIHVRGIDDLGHEGQLLGGADGAADAGGVVGRGLLPSVDVFEGLGAVEVFERVVEDDLEAGAGQLQEFLRRELRSGGEEGGVERGVVPPGGGEGREVA